METSSQWGDRQCWNTSDATATAPYAPKCSAPQPACMRLDRRHTTAPRGRKRRPQRQSLRPLPPLPLRGRFAGGSAPEAEGAPASASGLGSMPASGARSMSPASSGPLLCSWGASSLGSAGGAGCAASPDGPAAAAPPPAGGAADAASQLLPGVKEPSELRLSSELSDSRPADRWPWPCVQTLSGKAPDLTGTDAWRVAVHAEDPLSAVSCAWSARIASTTALHHNSHCAAPALHCAAARLAGQRRWGGARPLTQPGHGTKRLRDAQAGRGAHRAAARVVGQQRRECEGQLRAAAFAAARSAPRCTRAHRALWHQGGVCSSASARAALALCARPGRGHKQARSTC